MGNTSSMLTQYDIEEVQEHCDHACEFLHKSSPSSFFCRSVVMRSEELRFDHDSFFSRKICNPAVSQQEIVSLYHRFCQLDRNGSGFISSDEFLSVPEFAVNPLSQRLLRMLDGLNFKEFVAFLSAFSSRTSLQQKIEFIFKVYDLECNGKVNFNDVMSVFRDLTGSFMTEQQRQTVLTHVLEEAGYTKNTLLTLSDFMKVIPFSC
ncbi:Calmodulin-like protein 9 [Apostasia shenzhenica]|uniref:Calmodulin-like protein 9 n=1 Tax=Apostasia shenzhenica TaxID=1088818 RepID=A0A2I0A0Z5_9ASPA|nr:Calmodulin-like protein 9 [Apostasia shenzhenica]